MRNFSNQSIESLYALLHDVVLDTAAEIQKAAEILQELRNRGEAHPLMRIGVLSKFREIASGKLSAKAAFVFAGVNDVLTRLEGLPIDQQEEIATTGIIPVVELDQSHRPVVVQKPILSATRETLDRVFGPGNIRSAIEQEKLIVRETNTISVTKGRQEVANDYLRTVGRFTVDVKRRRIKVGAHSIKVEEFAEPLRLLGYKLTKMDLDDTLV